MQILGEIFKKLEGRFYVKTWFRGSIEISEKHLKKLLGVLCLKFIEKRFFGALQDAIKKVTSALFISRWASKYRWIPDPTLPLHLITYTILLLVLMSVAEDTHLLAVKRCGVTTVPRLLSLFETIRCSRETINLITYF